jgi:hypothetical protein
MAPRAARSSRSVLLTVVLVLIGLPVLLGVVSAIVVFVVRATGDEDADQRIERSTTTEVAASDTTASTAPTTTAPVVPVRVRVGPPGLTWTMRGDATMESSSIPDVDGLPVETTAWNVLAGTDPEEVELAVIYELDGRTYDLGVGLQGVVDSSGGRVIGEAGPITIAGQPGVMVVAELDVAGGSIARYATVRFGDRALLLGCVVESTDPADGEQGFADLVASVQAS